MTRKAKVVAGGLTILLTVAAPVAAEAQGLGRLGRAVKERVANATDGGSNGSTTSSASSGSGRSRGAGFTADQLDRFALGLATEVEQRRALAGELEALQVRPDYEQCRLDFSMSPAGQRSLMAYMELVNAYYADPQNVKKQEAMQDAQRKVEDAARSACGPSPDEAPRMIQERQAGPVLAGAERAGVDKQAYARLKELVLPFCAAADRHEAGREAAIPSGAGKSYSYSAEDTALLKPRCEQLLPLLEATL